MTVHCLIRIPSLCLLLLAGGLIAQEFRASINGRVTDPSGAAIPGAKVTATNVETNVASRASTAASGDYVLSFLPPGRYQVEVEGAGFSKYVRKDLILRVQDRVRIDAVLELSVVTEKIQVVSETPLLETSTASVGEVITGETIGNMPLFGRNAYALVGLTSGVLMTSRGTSGSAQLRVTAVHFVSQTVNISGGETGSNEITLDGIPMTGEDNVVAFIPSVDSIQEFRVQSGVFDAEFGHFTGGVINTSTKSGTNQFHGAALWFHKDSALNARDFFAPSKPEYYEYQFGGSAGGPVYFPRLYNGRDRTFFFVNYEGNRRGLPRSWVATVPTSLQRSGDFSKTFTRLPGGEPAAVTIYDPATTRPSAGRYVRDPFPGNVIPATRFDRVARNILSLNLYPDPNVPGDAVTSANNYRLAYQDPALDDGYIVKVDHRFSERHQMFVRYAYRHFYVEGGGAFRSGATNTATNRYAPSVALDHTCTLNPTTVVNVRYGLARLKQTGQGGSVNFDFAQLGFPPSLGSQLQIQALPSVAVSGLTTIGNQAKLSKNADDTHSLRGSILKQAGPHSMRFGAEFRAYRVGDETLSGAAAGSYSFNTIFTRGPNPQASSLVAGSGLASFLLGAGASGSVPISTSRAGQQLYQAFYFQDDFRVSRRLSLNLGLRYEWEGPYTERYNRINRGFDVATASPIEAEAKAAYAKNPMPEIPPDRFRVRGGLLFAGVGGQPRGLTEIDRRSVSPRVGTAFMLTPKTVVRGGFGMFYGSRVMEGPTYGFSSSTPWLTSIDGGLTPHHTLSNPFPGGILQPAGASGGLLTQIGQGVTFDHLHQRQPYSIQSRISLQRELRGGVLLEAIYSPTMQRDRGVTQALSPIPEVYRAEARKAFLETGRNILNNQVPNPFYGLITTGTLSTATIARSQLLTAYPHFTSLSESGAPLGSASYHALQVKATKRLSRGLSFMLAYTAGKSLLQTSYLNDTDTTLVKQLADYDIPRRLVLSGTYELPFGRGKQRTGGVGRWLAAALRDWQINWLYTAQSGIPLAISNGESVGRSAYVPPSQRTLQRWFDTGAFRQRETLELVGTARLPDVRSHGRNNVDFSLFRQLRLSEAVKLQFRAEAFNACNRTEFDVPDTSVTSSSFGVVTAVNYASRNVQFAVKVLW